MCAAIVSLTIGVCISGKVVAVMQDELDDTPRVAAGFLSIHTKSECTNKYTAKLTRIIQGQQCDKDSKFSNGSRMVGSDIAYSTFKPIGLTMLAYQEIASVI